MKNSNHKEKVRQLIAHKAGMEPKEILDEMFFGEDLNLGELELTEILEELEDLFQIDLLNEQGEIESVKDLLDALDEKLE
jgi:acyl carrier protein